jgi:hypothetical protein
MLFIISSGMAACTTQLLASFEITQMIGMIEGDIHCERSIILKVLLFMAVKTNIIIDLGTGAGII